METEKVKIDGVKFCEAEENNREKIFMQAEKNGNLKICEFEEKTREIQIEKNLIKIIDNRRLKKNKDPDKERETTSIKRPNDSFQKHGSEDKSIFSSDVGIVKKSRKQL